MGIVINRKEFVNVLTVMKVVTVLTARRYYYFSIGSFFWYFQHQQKQRIILEKLVLLAQTAIEGRATMEWKEMDHANVTMDGRKMRKETALFAIPDTAAPIALVFLSHLPFSLCLTNLLWDLL